MSFKNLREEGVEKEVDRVGGGYVVPDSDIYDLEIKIGYLGKSKGGANNLTLLGTMNGEEFRNTIYFTAGTEKGGGIAYTDKQGKKRYLPGYQILDDLALIATNGNTGLLELLDSDLEEKVVKVYDSTEKKEVNQSVQAVASFMGIKVKVAWLKKLETKNVKDEATNRYVPTDESREVGEIVKILSEDGYTVRELMDSADAPDFQERWLKANKGRVQDTRKNKDGGKAGAPPAAGSSAGESAAPRQKLFGKKP